MNSPQQVALSARLAFLRRQAARADALPEAVRARAKVQYTRLMAEIAEIERQLAGAGRLDGEDISKWDDNDERLPLHRRWPPQW